MDDSNSQSSKQRLLTLKELSAELQVSPKTIYRWVNQGKIPHLKLPRYLRFNLNEVLTHFKESAFEQSPCGNNLDLLFASSGLRSERNESCSLKTSEKRTLSIDPKKGR